MSTDTTYQTLYRETIPSVVSVYVTPAADGHGASGSGFVYDESHVVTNHHVVAGVLDQSRGRPRERGRRYGRADAPEVDLRFADGAWRVGRVVGVDPYTDLAVVEVSDLPADARPLSIADATPAPGTPVAALGNPMGLDGSISTGIVSGASRSMPTGAGFALPDTVQTDAPVNPGNSGGPLVTTDGEVVGVNRARGGDNIGFAVSADVVRRVVPALVAAGEYRHPYLKIRTLDVSPSVAAANGLDEPRGVLVVDVSRGPARGALVGCDDAVEYRSRKVPVGGDVIVAVDGETVDSHEELMRYLLLETRPGEEVAVALLRDGRRVTETVTLAERPALERPRSRGRRGRRGRREGRGRRDPHSDDYRRDHRRDPRHGSGGHHIPVR